MKIKVWAFVLIIVGAVALSAAGTLAMVGGVSAVTGLVRELRQARASIPQSAGYSFPWQSGGSEDSAQNLPDDQRGAALPANFNAGVSIPGTYGEMTGRTEDEVLAAAEKAGMTAWGLAEQEGKLDELKQKVQEKVEASLKQMVSKGTITQAQSDAYLSWVKMFLASVGDDGAAGAAPEFGQGSGNWWDSDRQQGWPNATAEPGAKS
jgi:hypothetical protein